MLIAIVGATGTGKSALSLDIAEALAAKGQPAEIVNADAMQLYRGMDVGTAKLPESERRGIPHHMLDVLDVTDEASVSAYQTDARNAITEIQERGATPILVGGSGLYVSSVIFDFQFPGKDAAIREKLKAELESRGPGLLFEQLRQKDSEAAASIGSSNGRRIVRALEVIELTGEPFGAGLPDDKTWTQTTLLGLRTPRAVLTERLDARVAAMWAGGLLAEVEQLLPKGLERGVTASRAIGYAQAIAQLKGDLTEKDAIEQAAALTRRYARRQVGWFRRYRDVTWLDTEDTDDEARLDQAMARLSQ
jgi:tRNA dimethylallyltransferase